MPYTTVVAGTTITAAYANANIRDQAITPFATVAARDSAITSPVVGMMCYTADVNCFWHYRGTAWRPLQGQYLYAAQNLTYQQYGANQIGTGRVYYTSPDVTLPAASLVYELEYMFSITSTTMTVPTQMYTVLDVSTNGGGVYSFLTRTPWTHMGASASEQGTDRRYLWKAPAAITQARFRLTLALSDTTHGFDYGTSTMASEFMVRTTNLLSSEVAAS